MTTVNASPQQREVAEIGSSSGIEEEGSKNSTESKWDAQKLWRGRRRPSPGIELDRNNDGKHL
jgi:hypothetical protein